MTLGRILIAVAVLTLNVFIEGRGKMPCSIQRGECKADLYEDIATKLFTLEISCQCKYRRDVSKNLTALYPIPCPGIPNDLNVPLLHNSTLRIQNCDVVEEAFPVDLLLILRRSKFFKILIEDSHDLRFNSTKIIDSHPVIQARFKNSHINGLMKGWFTNSSAVSLKISNCSIGVMEILFLGYFPVDARVDVEFENTIINTISHDAIYLPPNGTLHLKGGEIVQLEGRAISGGRELSFQGLKIANIMSQSVNIFGLQSFLIDSCVVMKIDQGAIIDEKIPSFPDTKYSCDSVKIILNKFVFVHGEAFEGFCRAKNLVFKNNFMRRVTSSLALKASTCGTSRDWWSSLENNGFRCDECNSLTRDINEQVCALYGTGWCLCEDRPNSTSETIAIGETNKNVPCTVPFNHYLANHCGNTNQLDSFLNGCSKYSEKIERFTARQNQPLEKSGCKSSYVSLVLQCCLLLFVFHLEIKN